jgi:hypothetical protein
MFSTASEAMEGLRHKRTGEILQSKVIDRNTKLVYLDDEMIGLRFHDTIIAKYMRDHVVIDTRDRFHPEGWFTVTTWQRIDEWTPARTFTRNGLRHICVDPSAGWGSTLFAHGAIVSPDGSCKVPGLTPAQADAIISIKNSWPTKAKRYAKRVVKAWKEWRELDDCCRLGPQGSDDEYEHLLTHFERGEVVVSPMVEDEHAATLRQRGLSGDALCAQLAEDLAHELKTHLIPIAIRRVAPEFPYPQLQRNSR